MSSELQLSWFTRADDERVLWSGRPRLATIATDVAVVVVSIVVLGAFAATSAFDPTWARVAVPVGLGIVGWSYLSVRNIEYVLTDAAVYQKTGVLGEHVTRVELSRVQNTDLNKGIVGTQLGFGTVQVDTAGSAGVELTIENVRDPEEVRGLLLERTKRASGDALRGAAGEASGAAGDQSVQRALEEARELRRVAESLERRFTRGQR
jgi:uncharacterized membrane protein YdbT with pleckstrin-like domain